MDNKIFDLEHVWHPYTSLTNPIPTYKVVSAKGTNLYLDDGNVLVDGMSSWWACCHGYGNEHIINAVKKQLDSLSHVMFAGIRHDPATELCKKIVDLTPKGLDYVFLADSGSVAVEIALKMAIQYQSVNHKHRTKFLTVRGGYHGDTLAAMSVTDPDGGINTTYQSYTPQQFFIERPCVPFNCIWNESAMDSLKNMLKEHGSEIAAFIIEPIQQGAGGMYFYHPNYLKRARELCTQYDVVFICDEIATGFGRTGELFACNYADISPDIMTLGKALTAGMMTLSAVVTNSKIRDGISNSTARVMMHGPTFMANPLACSCACASIDVLLSYDYKSKVKHIENLLKEGLKDLIQYTSIVKEVRVLGACGVVEMQQSVNTASMQSFFVNEGVWLRPFGNIIYIYPPFIISDDDLNKCINAVCKLIKISSKS
ncbi:MAG: adenosylmethionine--8-amino-7-oxononanoate transaminase [Succinivibrionaceae bacterium]